MEKAMLTAKEGMAIDPEILVGKPVFHGTRVSIKTLFDHLEVSSLDDFLAGYPTVSREQAGVVIDIAGKFIKYVFVSI